MNVTLRFLGALREQVGTASLTVHLAERGTYRDLLDAVAPALAAGLPGWGWDAAARRFSPRVIVSLSGGGPLREESTVLADGDEIAVVLPLGGG